MKVIFIKEFTYWHGGYEPKVYGPGEVDVSAEVAESAKLCGALEEEKTDSKADDKATSKPSKAKK